MELSCNICKSKKLTNFKKISNYNICVCKDCQLGVTASKDFLSRTKIFLQSYNFDSYNSSKIKYVKRFNKLIKIIKKFKKNGSVLEVGAGFGLFSKLLSENDFHVEVIEPFNKSQYIHKDKKIVFNKITLEKYLVQFRKKKFDIIILLDVLEHLDEPYLILGKLKKLLNNKGIIVIQLPNFNSLMARLCKNWAWWLPEEHKYHFSPKSIRLLLKKHQLIEKYFDTYEDFNDFKKNLDGNFAEFKNNFLKKINKALFYFSFFPFYFLLRRFIWLKGYGGLIFLVAS